MNTVLEFSEPDYLIWRKTTNMGSNSIKRKMPLLLVAVQYVCYSTVTAQHASKLGQGGLNIPVITT